MRMYRDETVHGMALRTISALKARDYRKTIALLHSAKLGARRLALLFIPSPFTPHFHPHMSICHELMK